MPPEYAAADIAAALTAELEELSGDAVFVVDHEDRIVCWSVRAAELFLLSADAVIGRCAQEILPIPQRATSAEQASEVLRQGKSWAAAPDYASKAPLLWLARPLRTPAGAVIGACYRVRSVAPPRGEPAQRGDPDAALLGFDLAAENMVVLDRQHRVLAINAAFQANTIKAGRGPLRIGEDLLTAAAPGTEAGFLDGFECARRGEHVQRARSVVFENGQEFDYFAEYRPIYRGDEVDAVLFGAVMVEPIWAQRATMAMLERALAVVPFVVLIADARQPDLPIVYASASVERLTGYRCEEIRGKNARMFQGRSTTQPALDIVRRAIARGESCDVILANERKDGTRFMNRLTLSPVRDDFGVVSHYIGIQEDVSFKEELLRRLCAAEADATTQRILAGVVHDLRNLLTVISANAGLLLADLEPSSAVSESLGAVTSAVNQAASLTHLLLAPVSRLKPVSDIVAVGDVLHSLAKLTRYALDPKIKLECDPVPSEARIVADRGRVERVLLNLILNARDAMPDGGRIRLCVQRGIPPIAAADLPLRQEAERYFTIAVQDDGPGMSDEVLANLFRPYQTTKSAGQGMGLGLATSASLIEAAGGFIRITSRVGAGTTVYVVLPGATEALPVIRRAWTQSSLVDRAVLIVEPDTSVRAALAATLRRRGAAVKDAGDIEVARRLLGGFAGHALLVLDGTLGEAAADLLRDWLSVPARRAIILGDLAVPEDRRVVPLLKPFDFDAFLMTASTLIELPDE